MDNQQLQTKKLELESDILTLTKQRDNLTSEIEKVSAITEKRTSELDGQISTQKTLLDSLTKGINELNKKKEDLIKFIDSEMTDLSVWKEKQLSELKDKTEDFEKTKAIEKESILKEKEEIKTEKISQSMIKKDLDKQFDFVLEKIKEADIKIDEAKKDTEAAQIAVDESSRFVQENAEKLEKIESDIKVKTEISSNLDKDIKEELQKSQIIDDEINDRLIAVKILEKAVKSKEESQIKKDEEQKQKEAWLNDREQTVGRAYNEVISKGGTINGS